MSTETVIILPPQPISANVEADPVEVEFMSAEKPVVLITGAAGRLGSQLAEACSRNYRVVGLDSGIQENTGVDSIPCDLNVSQSVVNALALVRERYGERLACVIHLGPQQDFSEETAEFDQGRMIDGIGRLLHSLRDFVVEQFVFLSSMLVMANESAEISDSTEDASKKESHDQRLSPRAYFEIERFIQRELSPDRGNIPTVILRIASVYDENCHSMTIAQQISRIYEKRLESYFYPGDVDRGQPFVRLDDLVDSFLHVIELRLELETFEIFLIAEPDIMSYAELQEQIGELLHGEEWTMIPIPRIVAKAGAWAQETIFRREHAVKAETVELVDMRYQAEIERTKKRLGWQPQHSLRDTLSKIIGSLKENPHRWYETNNLHLPGDEA
jgi:nucleoside-diphosphate-sugar epimerase